MSKNKTGTATNTPPLDTQAKKEEYIRNHLFDELRYMLAAATEWSIQQQLKLQIPGYEVQVYAMDSALLRARVLFEFFVGKAEGNYYCSDQQFGVKLDSTYYTNDRSTDDWSVPLHRHLMHAQDRSKPGKLLTQDGPQDLNEMPVYFAKEVLSLWERFESQLEKSSDEGERQLGQLAREKRIEAIRAAECVTRSEIAQQYARCKGKVLNPVFQLPEQTLN